MGLKRSKRYTNTREKVDRLKLYSIEDGMEKLKESCTANFEESCEVIFKMGINPKKTEHRIRGTTMLSHGTGKKITILAFAKGTDAKEAEDSGADYVGGADLAEKIEEGWLDFDQVVATPDMMEVVGKLGRILGPRGMMPSPKSDTVTSDIAKAVEELKKGKLEFRVDEYGNIHGIFGKCTFSEDELYENLIDFAISIFEERPEEIKGKYLRGVVISSTMGPGIKIDPDQVREKALSRML